MSPWGAAIIAVATNRRVLIELVVPHDEVQCAVIDFIEGCTNGIARRVADTSGPGLKSLGLTAGYRILLAKVGPLVLYLASEDAASDGSCSTLRKGSGIELECEPPID